MIVLTEIDCQLLPWLIDLAVDLALDNLRPRDSELVLLPAHRLDQYRQVQLATPGNAKLIRIRRVLSTQRDVVLELLIETLPYLPAGQVLALVARERRFVDLEGHADRRLIDLQGG